MKNIKKAMLAFALGAAMICGGSAVAKPANDQKNATATTTTQCPGDAGCRGQEPKNKKGKHHGHHHGKKNGRHGKKGGFMKQALQGIELTQAQKDSVKAISKRRHQQVAEGQRKLRQESMAAAETQMQQVLTPQQYAQFKANLEKMRSEKPGNDKKDRKNGSCQGKDGQCRKKNN